MAMGVGVGARAVSVSIGSRVDVESISKVGEAILAVGRLVCVLTGIVVRDGVTSDGCVSTGRGDGADV
jgi:hypothetical protein